MNAQSLYRYKDENGVAGLNNAIAAKRATKGCKVMDARTGKVVERGGPTVIDNSGNRIDQTPDDKILPPRCSSVEEILERPDRKLAMLNAEVTRIQTRVRVLKIELESGCQKELQHLQERERQIAE